MRGFWGVSNPKFEMYDARVSVIAPLWRAQKVCGNEKLRRLIRQPGLSFNAANGMRIRFHSGDKYK